MRRASPGYNAPSENYTLAWSSVMRYLGEYLVKSRSFMCSLDSAKRAFYRAANSIFGKIGRISSEEVILQLIKSRKLRERTEHLDISFPPITQWCSVSDVLFTDGKGVSDFSVLKYY